MFYNNQSVSHDLHKLFMYNYLSQREARAYQLRIKTLERILPNLCRSFSISQLFRQIFLLNIHPLRESFFYKRQWKTFFITASLIDSIWALLRYILPLDEEAADKFIVSYFVISSITNLCPVMNSLFTQSK